MSVPIDLEATITDAVNDAQFDSTPEVDSSAEVETSAADTSESTEEPTTAEPETESESLEVTSPAGRQAAEEPAAETPQDEFARLAGIQQFGIGNRENRIPYSRVKKITEKAVNEVAEIALGRKLNQGEKAIDVVKEHVAQIPQLTEKITDYEKRLESVGQFEDIMANDPQKFLTLLSKVPVYQQFFEFVEKASAAFPDGQVPAAPAEQPSAAVTQTVDAGDPMPEPDEPLADGSKVYSMAGLKKLLDWHGRQVETRLQSRFSTERKQLEDRFTPVAEDWQERRRMEAALPVIRKKIEEARTWHLFNESENDILEVLRKDPQISLEGAYQKVVFPKLVAERNQQRQQLIQETKNAPTSTSIPVRAATKPSPAPHAGPRKLEDVIKDAVDQLKR